MRRAAHVSYVYIGGLSYAALIAAQHECSLYDVRKGGHLLLAKHGLMCCKHTLARRADLGEMANATRAASARVGQCYQISAVLIA